MFEVETERDDELGDDVAEEGGGQVERDDPDCHHAAEDDLLDVCVAVEDGQVDVGQQETDEKADDPGGEHAHCELLRGVTHSVPIFYKVLTNARQTVDSRPAEIEIRCLIVFEAGDSGDSGPQGYHDWQEDGGEDRHEYEDPLVC